MDSLLLRTLGGAVGEGIMTVRFTSRTDAIRIIGAGHSES